MTAPAMPVTSAGFAPVDEEPSAAAGPPRLRWSVDRQFAQSGVAVSLLAAFVVAFTVVNDQSRVFIDAKGRSWPFTKLFSNGSTEGWN